MTIDSFPDPGQPSTPPQWEDIERLALHQPAAQHVVTMVRRGDWTREQGLIHLAYMMTGIVSKLLRAEVERLRIAQPASASLRQLRDDINREAAQSVPGRTTMRGWVRLLDEVIAVQTSAPSAMEHRSCPVCSGTMSYGAWRAPWDEGAQESDIKTEGWKCERDAHHFRASRLHSVAPGLIVCANENGWAVLEWMDGKPFPIPGLEPNSLQTQVRRVIRQAQQDRKCVWEAADDGRYLMIWDYSDAATGADPTVLLVGPNWDVINIA
jgi:hypothetical protein